MKTQTTTIRVTNDYISLYVTKRISNTGNVPILYFNNVQLQQPRSWPEHSALSLHVSSPGK